MPAYWLVKSEPQKYSFSQLKRDKSTVWDGVRNYEARNNLRAMKRGDLVLFYHSNDDKAVVGVARVRKEAYEDPTDASGMWSVVEIAAVATLKVPVPLDSIRESAELSEIMMLKRNRLSVTPVRPQELAVILALGQTKLPTTLAADRPGKGGASAAAIAPKAPRPQVSRSPLSYPEASKPTPKKVAATPPKPAKALTKARKGAPAKPKPGRAVKPLGGTARPRRKAKLYRWSR